MLRYGEVESNSSASSIISHANDCHQLAWDLRNVADSQALPHLNPDITPVVDQWFIEKTMVPMLVGHVSYPDDRSHDHGRFGWLNFTAPIVLFSYRGWMARSTQRWYRLGMPSMLADASVSLWSSGTGV